MKVALIVLEYNDARQTVKYVEKVSEYEVIDKIVVVDNNSSDESAMEILKEIESDTVAILQTEKNGGYSYGNNFGLKYLEDSGEKYDYVIISNSDIDVEEEAISRCIHVLESDEKAAIAAPKMYNSKNQPIRRSSWKKRTFALDVIHSTRVLELLFYKRLRDGEYRENEYSQDLLQVECISGAFFVAKYQALKEIGSFDENVFLFYEEDILAHKLNQKGYKTYSVNNTKFIHYESQTIGKMFSYYSKMKQLYKSKMYYQKNYNNIKWWQIKVFQILNIFRKIELIFEIPARKILKK